MQKNHANEEKSNGEAGNTDMMKALRQKQYNDAQRQGKLKFSSEALKNKHLFREDPNDFSANIKNG